MDNWLPQHKILLLVTVFFLAILAGMHFYFVRPVKLEVERQLGQVRSLSNEIRTAGWSTDESRLQREMTQKESELEHLGTRLRDLHKLISTTFAERLSDYGGDEFLFMDQVTRLDYADAYTNILRTLQQSGKLHLDPAVLGLSESSISANVYEMVLQLWTLDKVMRLALSHDLVPVREKTAVPLLSPDGVALLDPQSGNPRMAQKDISQVTLPKVRSYRLAAGDSQPYLLEIPLRFKAECTPRALHDFINRVSDCSNGHFLAVNRLEIFRLPPANDNREDRLQVQIEVCSYIRRRTDLQVKPPAVAKPLPRGA